MKRLMTLWMALAALVLAPAFAQNPAAPAAGKVHGKVINPTGAPQKGGSVSFVGPKSLAMQGAKNGEAAILTVNDDGLYNGEVPAGTFMVLYRAPGLADNQITDKLEKVVIVAGQENTVDVDMSRKEFIDALPADQRKQLEELKQKNKEATSANEVIKNINNDLKQVGQDIRDAENAHKAALEALGASASAAEVAAKEAEIKTAKYNDIVELMTKDIAVKGGESLLWAQLGQGQIGLKKYDDAEVSFKKVLELEAASKKPNLQIQSLAQGGLGEIYARAGKVAEANAAFDAAVKINPTQAVFFYKNEAVIFMQVGNGDAQAAAADQGLKADPTQPIFYYLKGQALVGKATIDQNGKIVLPAGCAEAYQKYLELAPTGTYAAEVKSILSESQQTHSSSFGSKGKGKGK
jgi:tetratricopeptide (TPR) repeat protein